jgi:nucleoside-triphosphatase THEP1
MKKNILLSGSPGCGKTSLILEVLKESKGLKAGGFYTSEIREGGERKGFKITSLNGGEAIMAHVDFAGPYRVSKYGVRVENLEAIALDALKDALEGADVIVIDEIGKMELFSEKVRQAILAALDSPRKVLGTVMMAPNPFADKIKARKDVEIIVVEKGNAAKIKEEIIKSLAPSS